MATMWKIGQQMPGGYTFAGWDKQGGKFYPLVKQKDGKGTMLHPAYKPGAPANTTPTPTPNSTPTPTGATGGGTGAATGQQDMAAALNNLAASLQPTNVITGPTQNQIALARQGAATAVAPLNAQIADLSANNFGRFNTRQALIGRDARIGKHDYNAQANASGFRRSGGVNTNNRAVNAQADVAGLENFNTLGQGMVNNLNLQKNQTIHSTIQGLLGGMASGLQSSIYEGYN